MPRIPSPPDFIAAFDSASAMALSTAHFLHGKDFPALGQSPLLKPPAARANLLPRALRKQLYIFSGWNEAIKPGKVDDLVDAEELSQWMLDAYPERPSPAVAIGSSGGAGVHLWSALGIPWLPQTFLVPVRQSVDPDEPKDAMEIGVEPGRRLLDANPDLQLHHMHDANQDRLMIRKMTYFRVKRRRLGAGYERFLEERLPPGSTIFVVECEQDWGTTRIGDRHVFQHGAVGGATEEEFHHGGPRVAEHLASEGVDKERWDSPQPDGRSPEAEWGFEPSLLEDIERIARERHYRVVRIRYPEPEALSPLVADLYAWWYEQRRIPSRRLVVESFIVHEPWWTLRTGSVPYWMEFNMEPSLERAHRFLDEREPFEEIYLMLMQHGAQAVGMPTSEDWATVFQRATRHGDWLGADPTEFPMDYAQYSKYHTEIQQIPARYPMPGPLSLRQLDDFLAEHGHRYDVRWEGWERPSAHRAA
jgi:hypothetical protein